MSLKLRTTFDNFRPITSYTLAHHVRRISKSDTRRLISDEESLQLARFGSRKLGIARRDFNDYELFAIEEKHKRYREI